jgi:hypothetical protein
MPTAVTRQESDAFTLERSDDESVGRRAEGRVDLYFFDTGQLGHLIKPAASDNADSNS